MHATLSVFNFKKYNFETSHFINFTSPTLTILCMSITWNPNKNLFKLQVVMQQNRKHGKGAWHLLQGSVYTVFYSTVYTLPVTSFKAQSRIFLYCYYVLHYQAARCGAHLSPLLRASARQTHLNSITSLITFLIYFTPFGFFPRCYCFCFMSVCCLCFLVL